MCGYRLHILHYIIYYDRLAGALFHSYILSLAAINDCVIQMHIQRDEGSTRSTGLSTVTVSVAKHNDHNVVDTH